MGLTDYEGAIFDLDGTLVDSAHVWSEVDRVFLGKRGIPLTEEYTRAITLLDFPKGAVYTKERFGLPDSVESIMAEWHDMARHQYAEVIDMIPGAREHLIRLHERGVLLALATASSAELYEPVLKRHGVLELFTAFATTDEVERGKGYPDVYELAAKRLGLSPEKCIVYEDIPEGIAGAIAGGFAAAAVAGDRPAEDYPGAQWILRDLTFRE